MQRPARPALTARISGTFLRTPPRGQLQPLGLLLFACALASPSGALELRVNTDSNASLGSFTEAYLGSEHGLYPEPTTWGANVAGSAVTLTGVVFPDVPGSPLVPGLTIADPGTLVGSLTDRGDGSFRVRFPTLSLAFTTSDGHAGSLDFDLQTSAAAAGSPAATILADCGAYEDAIDLFGNDWKPATGEISLIGHVCYDLGNSGFTRAFVVTVRGTLSDCGNGVIDAGEQCDDSNALAGDCCDAACQLETGPGAPPCCNAGVCQVGQACGAVCFEQGTCYLGGAGGGQCLCGLVPAACSNGVLDAGEQCDDGNTAPGDCCSPTCQFETGPGAPSCCNAGDCQLGQTCGILCFGSGTCQQPGGPGTTCSCDG